MMPAGPPSAFASAHAFASAQAFASGSGSGSGPGSAVTFALAACSVGFEGRPHVLYVEQEPARGQDLEGGAEWTVADALTEPMAAGESASTPGATETAAALRAVRPHPGRSGSSSNSYRQRCSS